MRWKSLGIAAAVLLVGAVLAACRPVTPPPPPPPPPPTTPPVPGLPAMTAANWTSPALDGTIQAQPVFVPDPSLANGVGVVVVATESDRVYGLNPSTGAVLWGPVSIGTAEPLAENDQFGPIATLPGCGDIDPLGITSNPVLDTTNGDVYVVGEREMTPGAASPHAPEHVMAGINPATGAFVLSPTNIDPSAMTVAAPGSTQNQITGEQQRTGLVAANGQVYVGFGGLAGDCGPYHGFVVGVNESDGSIASSFESATAAGVPNDREGAVWAPGGMAIDSSGTHLYAATGNSQEESSPTPEDYSDAVVQLNATALTTPTNVFQPSTFVTDNIDDLDLGSSAPLLVNAGAQVFQIGKRGAGYLLSASSLALASQLQVCSGGSFGSVATIGSSIFVPCRGSVMKQLVLSGTGATATMAAGWTSPSNVTAGGPAVADPSTNLIFSADSGTNQLFGVSATTGLAMVRYPLALTGPEHFPTPGLGLGGGTGSGGQVFIESGDTVKAFTT